MADSLVFIPFLGEGQASQRSRELLDSKARRQISIVSHRRAKVKRYATLETKAEQEISRSKDHTVSHAGDDSTCPSQNSVRLQVNPTSYVLRRSASITDASPRRTTSWNFGSLGGTCKLTDLHVAAFRFFSDLNIGVEPRPEVRLYVQETFQRAVDHPGLLAGLVSATTFEMANNCSRDGNPATSAKLIIQGREQNARAMYLLRQALASSNSICSDNSLVRVALFSTTAHLCIAAIRAGDHSAAYIHLKYIFAVLDAFPADNVYIYILLSTLTAADLRTCLIYGTTSVVGSIEYGRKVIEADIGTGYNKDYLQKIQERWTKHEDTYLTDFLEARLDNFCEENPGAGFWWAVTSAGLILPDLFDTIYLYHKNCAYSAYTTCPFPKHQLHVLGNEHWRVLFKLCLSYNEIRMLRKGPQGKPQHPLIK